LQTIYADWNEIDDHGRLYLNFRRSIKDLCALGDGLVDGAVVTLNIQDEFQVQAELVYDKGSWRAIPDRSTISFPPRAEPTD
jgi:hypothetical protein